MNGMIYIVFKRNRTNIPSKSVEALHGSSSPLHGLLFFALPLPPASIYGTAHAKLVTPHIIGRIKAVFWPKYSNANKKNFLRELTLWKAVVWVPLENCYLWKTVCSEWNKQIRRKSASKQLIIPSHIETSAKFPGRGKNTEFLLRTFH
jgi:hypothetical protein